MKSPEAEKVAKESPAKVEETTPEKTSDKGSILLQFRHFVIFWYGEAFKKIFQVPFYLFQLRNALKFAIDLKGKVICHYLKHT